MSFTPSVRRRVSGLSDFSSHLAKDDPDDFDQVLKEEEEFIRRKRSAIIGSGAEVGEPFSLAFSGGGIRAAAFQSGVLWRLAEAGLLKDVEYFAAVSGGAYIASSFASFCDAEPRHPKENIDSWYLRVVSKSICRMQHNAGGFVRDLEKDPFKVPVDGSGVFPRVFDLPIFMVCLGLTIIVNPLQAMFVFLVPVTEILQIFFSAGMRAVFCAPETVSQWYVLMSWSPIGTLIRILEVALAVNFVVWAVYKMPWSKLSDSSSPSEPRSLGYLLVRGTLAFLVRFSSILVGIILLIVIIPNMQLWMHSRVLSMSGGSGVSRQELCRAYMTSGGTGLDGREPDMGCANFYNGKPWYRDALFLDFANSAPDPLGNSSMIPGAGRWAPDEAAIMDLQRKALQNRKEVLSIFFTIVALILLVSALLVPFEPTIFISVLTLIGPMLACILVMILVQYRIYGPITGQPLVYGMAPFDHRNWNIFVAVTLLANLFLVPFYNSCKSIWHWYYLRSLKSNFFADGEDFALTDLKRDGLICPLLMFTGTVNDFVPLGHQEPITEIFFSPLHTGGPGTGFAYTPQFRTLGKCTALTGAGCLDAISLSMSTHIRYRVWLELLNLSWGDYIIFRSNKRDWVQQYLNVMKLSPDVWRSVWWLRLRLPTMFITSLFVAFLAVGWVRARNTSNTDCHDAKLTVAMAVIVAAGMFVASFFGFLPGVDHLLYSPLIRELHQLTGHHFQGNAPPGLLYVTDGGVQDCTCLVQLMRRKCKRILLALAASDPNDELGVLRSAMDIAVQEKLGSFYDPDDPRRDVRILLEEYRKVPEMPYLRLGIRYGWLEDGEGGLGELFVVKNRLPPSFAEGPLSQMQPLLTEEEILSGECRASATSFHRDVWGGLRPSDLGGLGCCDCCHRKGCNCAGKFPHLTGANYLWLTPQLFNNLSRLGYHASEAVIGKLRT